VLGEGFQQVQAVAFGWAFERGAVVGVVIVLLDADAQGFALRQRSRHQQSQQ